MLQKSANFMYFSASPLWKVVATLLCAIRAQLLPRLRLWEVTWMWCPLTPQDGIATPSNLKSMAIFSTDAARPTAWDMLRC